MSAMPPQQFRRLNGWQRKLPQFFFRRRARQDPFAPLWESIHLWAEWARNETSWVKAQLTEKTANSYAEAVQFERAFIQDLLSVLSADELAEALRFLNTLNVDFGWIEAVDPAIVAAASAIEGRSLDAAS